MAFASIYVPNFMVQAVMRGEPALRKCGVALVDGTPPVWTVVAVNETASQAGVESGMAKSQAMQFCGVEIRERSRAQEQSAHAALLDLGWSVSPRVEDTTDDSILVDIAGLESLFGSEEKIAKQLVQRALDLGMSVHVAIARNLDAARHAARGFPGITLIPEGEQSRFLGALPIYALSPPGEIHEILDRWGIYSCAALAALPAVELAERLGQHGIRLQEWARGTSLRSMTVAEPAVVFEEQMEVEYGVAELEPLAFLLGRLLDQLCARLQARSLAACGIRLRFELESCNGDTPQQQNRNITDDAAPTNEVLKTEASPKKNACKLFEKTLTLPVAMRDSKMLLRLLRLQLQSDPPPAPIVRITIGADPARPRVAQGGLFLPASPDPAKLELTIARLAHLVGHANVGAPELMDTHRPGEFRLNRFAAPHERLRETAQGRLRAAKKGFRRNQTAGAAAPGDAQAAEPAAGFRIFRPSPPATVELREGRPVRICFQGMRGDVVAVSGPWRTSGDWWHEDGWQHDEWDLEIRFVTSTRHAHAGSRRREAILHPFSRNALGVNSHSTPANTQKKPSFGLYRIYYDSLQHAWFVRGVYD